MNVFIRFKCALRRFKWWRCLKRVLDIWDGDRSLGPNSRKFYTQTLVVLLAHPLYAHSIREERTSYSVIQLFDHLQSIHSRCSDTEVCHLWCFSLADLIVGVQMAARAPLCPLLFRYSQTEQNEGAPAREDKPRTKTHPVNRRKQRIFSLIQGSQSKWFMVVQWTTMTRK